MNRTTTLLHNLLDNLIAITKVLVSAKSTKAFQKVNTESNKEIFILANGPSLKNDLSNKSLFDQFRNNDVLVVNFFSLSDEFYSLRPKYNIIVALDFFKDQLEDEYVDLTKKWHKSLQKINWPMKLFVPYEARNFKGWQQEVLRNKCIEVIYLNYITIVGSNWLKFKLMKRRLAVPRLHNVLGPAIMVALWSDYKKINLFGVDHSWLPLINVDHNNRVFVGHPHFYEEEDKQRKQMGTSKRYRKLHEVLDKFLLTFKGYFDIDEYAKKQGAGIYNFTKESFIDAFEKK